MKVITPKLASAYLLPIVAAIAAQTEKYDEGRDVIHFFGNFRGRYGGHVTAVEQPAQGEARVRILATTEYLWKKDQPGEREERKVFKECVLHWTRGDQPVPFIVGMDVLFTAKDDGNVTAAMVWGVATLPYYRKNADGLIEVLLGYEVLDGKKVWLRAQPDRINLMDYVMVAWSRQHGLVISMFTDFETGGGETEEESPSVRTKGLPVSNMPGERIYIGREGWNKTPPDLSHKMSKRVVPPKQYIGAAR